MRASAICIRAHAKINLDLRVLGPRADGFHELRTVFQAISLYDTIACVPREGPFSIDCATAGVPLDRSNLIWRAAAALWRALRRPGEVRDVGIQLEKRIPLQAGLGGGSADAAATLMGLARMWRVPVGPAQLTDVAASLGADVPFFVGGENAFVEGIGERLTPLAVPRQWLAVVKPAAGLATCEVFSHPALVRDTPAAILSGFLADASQPGFWDEKGAGWGRNDLQPPAKVLCPEVAQAAEWLDKHFGNSRMTGSGSAVFARNGMGDRPLVTWPAQGLAPGWVGRMCRSLDQHPLAGWNG